MHVEIKIEIMMSTLSEEHWNYSIQNFASFHYGDSHHFKNATKANFMLLPFSILRKWRKSQENNQDRWRFGHLKMKYVVSAVVVKLMTETSRNWRLPISAAKISEKSLKALSLNKEIKILSGIIGILE